MKTTCNLITGMLCLFGATLLMNNALYAQGNSGGNANSNNNANNNALKWEMQGNTADTSHFIGTTNAAPLKFRTNNVERLHLTPDGKLGVGISNPIARLQVQGDLKLSGDVIFSGYEDLTDSLGRLLFVDENGKTYTKTLKSLFDAIYTPIYEDCQVEPNGDVLAPIWHNGLNKIYTNCPINVGIRTLNPLYALDVRGQIRASQNIFLGIPGQFSFNPLARLHIVNVASLAPNNKGDFLRFDDFSISHLENNLFNVLRVDDKGGLIMNYIGQGKVLDISSKTENRKLLQLYNNGLMRAREIKVDMEIWPDYVFSSDYILMPLNQVKEFISQNGHLPNVPSAAEIEEDGLNLGQTARITMEKVEELTLYVIEQQEKLEEQQEQLDEQKKLLEEQKELIELQKKALEGLMLKLGKQ
ncbi:MAG: hypothetical protein R3277_01340 [Brumimicrobium sp.]|nr:hypothetical protein [Brumimicrobium sp.]